MAFTRFTKSVLNVSALPDRVQNQAQTLKATFDQAGVDIKAALNALIAELEASTSADNIGADVQSVATKTVQAILTAFEEEIADRYTKTEADALIATGTNDLVADIDVNLTTGVITVTKKDGTVETFDTAIEKVPAKFEVVESGDTFALKITNVDGTSTQTDITNFMNIYNFNNSDYITFEVTGEGTQKTVTANIKANSIGLDKLSLSVVSTLEGYMTSARDSATAAKTSETNARASELSALEAKSSAEKSAEDAEYWAKQAQAGGGGITEIPVATADTLGGIKVGNGLSITEDGTLSAEGGGASGTAIETVLFEGKHKIVTSTMSAANTLSDNIKNYDFVYVTLAQEVPNGDYAGYLLRQMTIAIDVATIYTDGDKSFGQWYAQFGKDEGALTYAIIGTFGDGTQIGINAFEAGSTATSRNHYITRVVGIKNGGLLEVDTTPTEGSVNPITSGATFTALSNKADATHTQDASTITAGTFAGKVVANGTEVATLNSAQVRNIQASTTDLTAGTSTLASGNIHLVYE